MPNKHQNLSLCVYPRCILFKIDDVCEYRNVVVCVCVCLVVARREANWIWPIANNKNKDISDHTFSVGRSGLTYFQCNVTYAPKVSHCQIDRYDFDIVVDEDVVQKRCQCKACDTQIDFRMSCSPCLRICFYE